MIHIFTVLQGYDFREAVDGMEGVQTFQSEGYFEYVDQRQAIYLIILINVQQCCIGGSIDACA